MKNTKARSHLYSLFIFTTSLFLFNILSAQYNVNGINQKKAPQKFISTGIGGGGGLFSPSINPLNNSEFYTVCDLGALFHTENGGSEYEYVPFTEVSGIIFSKISFTNDNNIRYTLKWDEPSYASRPAKTTDAGLTWRLLEGDSQEWEDKYFIYADFNNPDRVIWSTYDNIWITFDGGKTDKLIYTGEDGDAGVLLSGVYFDDENIYFGTNDGILISNDGGQTVVKAGFSGIPNNERIMGFGAGSANGLTRFFVLTGGDGDIWCDNLGSHYWETIKGVYSMDNVSGVWTKKMNGIDISKDWAVYLAMATNDPNTCYIAGGTEVPYEKPFVMKTSDGGDSWEDNFITNNNENIYTGYQGYQGDFDYWWGGYAMGFTVNPLNSDQVIITDLGYIHQTTDGGSTWHQAYLNSEDENTSGVPTPKNKSYRGIGMEQTSVWQVHWFDEQNIFGCFTDIKGIKSTDAGNSWSMDYEGHNLNTLYHMAKHNSEDIWFASTSAVHDMYETTYIYDYTVSPSWKEGKVLITKDKGATFQTLKDFGTPVVWVTTDPNNDDILYASVISPDDNGGIWKATNISDPTNVVWTHLPSPENTNIGRPHNIHVLDDGTIVLTWAVRNYNDAFQAGSGVFVSTDGGNTWIDRSHNDMRYWTQDIVIDPFDEDQNTWYVGVWSAWGGNGNNLGRLWRTTNRGITWNPMTEAEQFHRVYSATVDPTDEETMYLTTETEGLWVTHNKSANNPDWNLVESYPYHAPRRVFFNPYNEYEMWVASFGGGMMYGTIGGSSFELDVADLPDIIGECSIIMPNAPTATDQSGKTIIGTTTNVFPITTQGTTIIIWEYIDGNGNIIEQPQKIIINDITLPFFDVSTLDDITSECEISELIAPTATDNCSGVLTGFQAIDIPITESTIVLWKYDDGNGNISEQSQEIIITEIDNSVTVNDITLTANASGYIYQWLDCDNGNLFISGEANQEYTPSVSGNYGVEISSEDCSIKSECQDVIISGIEEEFISSISIFPNPTNQHINVKNNSQFKIESIGLYNQIGQIMLLTKGYQNRIDITMLPNGIYFMEIEIKNQLIRKKVVID